MKRMICEKCKNDFNEEEIHEHHIIPKRLGGKDKDGRIQLCKKCHQTLHIKIVQELILFTKQSIKEFTENWLKNG